MGSGNEFNKLVVVKYIWCRDQGGQDGEDTKEQVAVSSKRKNIKFWSASSVQPANRKKVWKRVQKANEAQWRDSKTYKKQRLAMEDQM